MVDPVVPVLSRATRRSLLLLPLLAAACGGGEGLPVPLAPPNYSYLSPLRVNVLDIDIVPPSPGPQVQVDPPAPLIPAELMQRMAQQRLSGVGTVGRARFITETATLTRNQLSGGSVILMRSAPQRLSVVLRCRLEILGGDGRRAGFAEAEVRRTQTLPDNNSEADITRAADTIVRLAMDDLNVEFEYQLRRNLRDWLMETSPNAPAAAPVQREDLPRT
jgi:hypothetical protein